MRHSPSDIALRIGPVSTAIPAPLYRQVVDGFKRAIGEGHLAGGESLPSFRMLAEQLLVSVITVRRAYDELEREGIIYRRQGLGTFVAQGGDSLSRESKREQARQLIQSAINETRDTGLSDDEVASFIQNLLKEALSGKQNE